MKYTYLLLLTLFLLTTACNQSQSGKKNDSNKILIGISMLSMQNEFIVNISDEMQNKAKELGAELIIVDGERSPLKQIEQIESFIAQKVDVIILNPCEYEACSPAVT
jgi:inositol transport system substrate-binding protein